MKITAAENELRELLAAATGQAAGFFDDVATRYAPLAAQLAAEGGDANDFAELAAGVYGMAKVRQIDLQATLTRGGVTLAGILMKAGKAALL